MNSQFQRLESLVAQEFIATQKIARCAGSMGLDDLYADASAVLLWAKDVQEDLSLFPGTYQPRIISRLRPRALLLQ